MQVACHPTLTQRVYKPPPSHTCFLSLFKNKGTIVGQFIEELGTQLT